MRNFLVGTLLCVLLSLSTVLRADVIEFKSGQRIEGEVLKDSATELVVDIGVDIIRIPTSQIKSRTVPGKTAAPVVKANPSEIYATAPNLPTRNIKELSETYGEGVVLVQTPSGLGSGFIIDERGYCITNCHVVEKETRIAVTIYHQTNAGEFVRRRIDDVKILAINAYFDLALLQIPVQKDITFKQVFLGRSNELKDGDDVFAIGNPLGLERSVSQGIVSTRNRNFEGLTFIQTTTVINPGNSGGPLFNLKGEVVGVTNMKLRGSEGLGFAIPVTYLKLFLDNRDAFAFDKNNPNTGYRYLDPPRRKNFSPPPPADASAK